jgi:16S rRNA (adenine1518-N6/adenine1519-N6)-dimethyltransferase
LTDPAILDRIVAALEPCSEDLVIEVGPGRGSLTRRLAPLVGRVLAIERDKALVAELRGERRAGAGEQVAAARQEGCRDAPPLPDNVTVVAGDALQLDWVSLLPDPVAARGSLLTSFKVIGNIPYYASSPLIEKALTPPRPSVTVFLLQREVAERMLAVPGSRTYGALSVGVQSLAEADRVLNVKPGSFHPPPKVDSVVVRIRPRTEVLLQDEEQQPFRRFVTALFARRRKQLRGSLRSLVNLSRQDCEEILIGLGIDPTARPEMLSPPIFVSLFRAVPR